MSEDGFARNDDEEGRGNERECLDERVRQDGRKVRPLRCIRYDASKKMTEQLDDQQPMQFAGEKVKVTGSHDKTTKTLHITDIRGAS